MNVVAKRLVVLARKMNSIGTGYSQDAKRRWSVLDKKNRRLIPNKDVDCSASFAILAWLSGIPWDLSTNTWTGNIAQKAKATGMYDVTLFDGDLSKVRPGGALVEPGHHIATMLDNGEMLSPEQNELHKTTGGRPGEQKPFEVRIRKAYKRRSAEKNGGWKYLINLTPVLTHMRRAIVALGKGEDWRKHIKRMSIVAPNDGPATGKFIERWISANHGMSMFFEPPTLPAYSKLALVVLGTKLHDDGTLTKKYEERLALVLKMAKLYPNAVVIVSGGKPYNGITEAQAGITWLHAHGLTNQVYGESKSGSTIGNALYTVPFMAKLGISHYMLVSHASHLRRAHIDFLAAALKIENDTNKSLGLTPLAPLAVNDYAGPIKPCLPVSDSDRAAMATEVLRVLDL